MTIIPHLIIARQAAHLLSDMVFDHSGHDTIYDPYNLKNVARSKYVRPTSLLAVRPVKRGCIGNGTTAGNEGFILFDSKTTVGASAVSTYNKC